MNELCIYIALYCVLFVHPKHFTIICVCGGGSLLNHHQCGSIHLDDATAATEYGACALTTHQLQVERRESHRTNQVDGDY